MERRTLTDEWMDGEVDGRQIGGCVGVWIGG